MKPTQITTKPMQLLNILIKMEKDGLSKTTIHNTNKYLSLLSRNCNLDNPDEILTFIAHRNISDGFKRILAIAYNKYAQYYQIKWNMPKYHQQPKPIKIPTKEKVEMLIANAKKPLSTKLQISAETGLRSVELVNPKVKDTDLDKRLLYPITAKHGAVKYPKMSNKLTEILREHILSNKLNPNDKLFKSSPQDYSRSFREARKRLANKLYDQTINTIRLYDLRHYFATTLYAKTRDILLVKQQMGHKKIETTLIYTQLLNLNDDEWTCKTATKVNEATSLIEAGFEYVTDLDGIKLLKKRK